QGLALGGGSKCKTALTQEANKIIGRSASERNHFTIVDDQIILDVTRERAFSAQAAQVRFNSNNVRQRYARSRREEQGDIHGRIRVLFTAICEGDGGEICHQRIDVSQVVKVQHVDTGLIFRVENLVSSKEAMYRISAPICSVEHDGVR